MIQIVHPALPPRGRLFAGPQPDPVDTVVASLVSAGITTVACLLESHKIPAALQAAYTRAGFDVLRFPIRDYGVPGDINAFRRFLRDVRARLEAGESVYLHCRGGIGRTGTALACLFILGGEAPAAAVGAVRRSHHADAVETTEQREFVEGFEAGGAA